MSLSSEKSSDEIIKSLREEGLIPYSSCTTYCAATAGVVVGVFLMRVRMIEIFRGIFSSHDIQELDPLSWITLFVTPLLMGALFALLGGIAQTRFYLHFSQNKGRAEGDFHASSWIFDLSLLVLRVPLIAGGVALLWILLFRESTLLLINGAEYLALWAQKSVTALTAILCMLVSMLGILSWILARGLFVIQHREHPSVRGGR